MDYIIIDKTSKIPLYMQISDSIRHHINLGTLKHGTQLPTEVSVCVIYEVSVIVVKQAYDDLVKKGLVKRIRGKGTFVDTIKPHVLDLSSGVIGINRYLSNAKRTVVSFEKTNQNELAAQIFDMPKDTYFYVVKIVTIHQDNPIIYQHVFLPEKYFPNLKKEDIKHRPMFDLIVNEFKLEPKNLDQTYRPINMNAHIAMMLDAKKGEPAHFIRSFFTDDKKNMLGFFTIYARAKYLEFEVNPT